MTSRELRIFVPAAIRVLMDRLAPRIEAAAGVSLIQLIDLNPAIPKRIAAGEPFDVALTNPPFAKSLFSAGHADAASHRAFGRVPLAVGRKAGEESPVITETSDISVLLREADSMAYTGAGTSGWTYLEAKDRLGLSDAVMTKSRAVAKR